MSATVIDSFVIWMIGEVKMEVNGQTKLCELLAVF